jgi:hypothetical protein
MLLRFTPQGLEVIRMACTWRLRQPQLSVRHLRGRQLQDMEEVRKNFPTKANTFRLGSIHLPTRAASGHLAIVGATGSGKTLLQRLTMQSMLPRIGTGLDQRALIYDAKQDVISLLAGMRINAPVHLLNPLDARAVAWDMAADITSPAAALQAAALLIPVARHFLPWRWSRIEAWERVMEWRIKPWRGRISSWWRGNGAKGFTRGWL